MMNNQSQKQRIAWFALGLFVAGLLLPFVSYALFVSRWMELPHQRAVNIAAGLGAVCEMIALGFGIIGWRIAPGKVAAIGSGLLTGLVLIALAAFIFR